MSLKHQIHRLLRWEYMPMWAFYAPLLPYYLYLSCRAGSLGFFSAVNPAIKNGGMALASKYDIYQLLPQKLYPKTLLVRCGDSRDLVKTWLNQQQIPFPVIAKPDLGYRGKGVKLLQDISELEAYLIAANFDVLVQEYSALPHEIGIFYHRLPNENKGHISGIVYKEGVIITGDGQSTLATLILGNPRYDRHYDTLEAQHGEDLQKILAKDATITLSSIGNHARGATFYDISDKCTANLVATFDQIGHQIKGFYYGRFDLKYRTWEELERGENIAIIELNGAISEPTHIYDPSHTYLFAFREVVKHWNVMLQIAQKNRQMGTKYLSFRECIGMLRENARQESNWIV